ncbi:hypothetical protein N658DRAFT_560553 [Parathielavia hyrcaniae]|uniref:Uncharacterized protein n=1 Tax=Parathielavia hyrcaniae TaxID=113614 RepID=A0AAN6T019_9PEZI|nr:hypothetical protein N658DRAFT_560553 [Parathielavia hyrcaniae]
MDHARAGYNKLRSEPGPPAQSRPSAYSARAYRTASPYSQAAKAERRQTEQRSAMGGWPARGASNPSIGADYTQDSHQRLADVARSYDPGRVERNESRQSLHEKYVAMMEYDRRMDEEQQGRGF